MPNDKTDEAVPRIQTVDARGRMYAQIAEVHARIVDAKWKARTGMGPAQVQPMPMLMHLEEAVHFLAEEMLECRKMIEEKADADPT